MIESQTLQFESGRALQQLYANDHKLLKTLEESLGVKVTARDGWLRLEGVPEQVDRAKRVFEQLEQARQSGVNIRRQEFSYALQSVSEPEKPALGDLLETKIFSSPR